MSITQRAVRWIAVRQIVAALHLQTLADLLGLEPLKRLGKAWAASAARLWKNFAKGSAE